MKKQSIPRGLLQGSPEGGKLGKQMLNKTLSKDIGKFLKMLCNILNHGTECIKYQAKFATHCFINRDLRTDPYRCIEE